LTGELGRESFGSEEAGLLDLWRGTELKSQERIAAIKLVLIGEEGEPLNRRGGREGRGRGSGEPGRLI
jgi:hypothetical protein